MWKEWLYQYNEFNGLKVLMYSDRLRNIVSWVNGNAELLPPVSVTIDPTNLCNIDCFWCKNKIFASKSPRSIADSQFLELPEMLSKWGVQSVVLSGGEPLLHPKIIQFLTLALEHGLRVGIKTNGVGLANSNIRGAIAKSADWISVSLDVASKQTYSKLKKSKLEDFDNVIEGIVKLVSERNNKKPKIVLKSLLHHLTYNEMYDFAELAKKLNVDAVHFTPLYYDKYKYHNGVRKTAAYHLREARKSFEDDNFKIYGIVHKYDQSWERIIRFEKCYAAALTGVFSADGKFYLCPDRRGVEQLSLGKFYPYDKFLEKWGSAEHKEMIKNIQPQACPRCSLCIANELVEKCIISDEMFYRFI